MKRAFFDKIKIIFHHFWRAIIEANKNFFLEGESPTLKEGENYKYLGMIEAEDITPKKLKKKSKRNNLGAPKMFLGQYSIVEISSKL